jgi:lipopolysaccharide transport system permease protein
MDSNTSVHVRPGFQWQFLGLGDIWQYRGLLLSLGIRDVKLRYKQTVFGVAWVVLQPLLSAGILTAVFGFIAAVPSPAGVPYFVFAYLGQMPWTLFSMTLQRTSGSMLGSMALVMKIYFPRPILPFSTVLSVLLDFAISFAIAIPLVVIYGSGNVNVGVAVVSSVALILCASGIGFFLAALSVRFRDVLMVLPVLVQLGLYASPVAYGLEVARDNLMKYSPSYFTVYMLNPAASLIESFRWAFLGKGLFLPRYFAMSLVASLLVFVAGFIFFRSRERKFADVI